MKKFFALLLAVCMVASLLPAVAFAAGETTTVADEEALKEAVAAGGEIVLGGNITLTAPITVNGTVVLDLKGYAISYDSTTMGEAMITNKGNLTINDSSDPDTGVIYYNYTGENDASYGKGNYTISNAGNLTVNGGKITIADLRQHAKYPIDNNSTTGDAILVINGGHLYNYNTSAIRQFCNSTTYKNSVTINGGLIEGYCAIWMQNPGKNTVHGKLTITGGELKSTAAAYVNGTSELKDVGSCLYFTIDGEGGAWSEGSSVSIAGGTFNENVDLTEEAPVAVIGEGAIFNGYCNVSSTAVAQIGDKYYTTLSAAIENAQPGQTVTLLSDVTISEKIVVTEDLIIEGNNKTLTYTGSNRAIEIPNNASAKVNVTISDLTVSCSASYCERGINYNDDGVLTLTNVTVGGTNLSYALNLPGSSNNCTVTISGGSYTGCIALNIWGANSKVDVTNAALTSVDKATHENYAAISLNNDGTTSAEGTVVTVTGGSITALDENGDASLAVRNSTDTATVSVSDTTAFNGISAVMVAIVDYGTTEFYSCLTLQDAIDQAVKDKENSISSTVKLLRDVELTETLIIPDGITVEKGDYEIKAAAGYTLTVSEDGKTYTVSVYVPPYIPPVVEPEPEPVVPEIEAPTVDTDAPVVDTNTTENEDGSLTKEETLENGTKVETTTNTDGSKIETATKTETVETDEIKTTTTTTVTTNTSADGEVVKESTQEVKEEKADGSATTTTTTVTETETKTEKVEVKEETVVNEDGTTETKTTATTETALSNGSIGTTTTDETGKVEAEVTVSEAAVQEAAAEDKPIELAMPAVEVVKTADEDAAAATVTVSLPNGTTTATVAIPVSEDAGAGTVAVIVNADGTETIITDSNVTENGLEAEVPDGAVIKVVDNSTDFDDVNEGDWEKDAVDFTSSRNIMNGMGEAEFAPGTPTTRAMVWTMLARYAGVDTTTGDTWDEVGRQWAVENGISDGTMADEEVTREQLVTMIWRFLGESDSDYDLSHFEDHDDTSDWAVEAKQWAVETGIITGVGQDDGTVTLDPKGDASRAQVAQMFYNFITKA